MDIDNVARNIRIYYWTFPTVFIAIITIWYSLRTVGCTGMLSAIIFIGLYGLILLTSLVALIFQIIKINKDTRHRVAVIIICLLTSLIAIGSNYIPNDFFKSRPILKANIGVTLDIGALTLRKDNTYSAFYGHIDWGCLKTGDYKISNDTIYLETNIAEQSDGILSSIYLIKDESYLLPLDRLDYLNDTTYWLKINKEYKNNWR